MCLLYWNVCLIFVWGYFVDGGFVGIYFGCRGGVFMLGRVVCRCRVDFGVGLDFILVIS